MPSISKDDKDISDKAMRHNKTNNVFTRQKGKHHKETLKKQAKKKEGR